jgi:hypothetical protein
MKIKNIIAMLIGLVTTLVVNGTATATSINYLVPGSNTGGFMMLSKQFAEEMNTAGVSVNLQGKGNCVNGMAALKSTTKPSIMIYTSETALITRKGCEFDSKAQLDSMLLTTVMGASGALCTMDKNLTAKSLKKKTWTVAVDNNRSVPLGEFLTGIGIKHKLVTYENSGGAIKGMLGGDATLSFTNSGKSRAVVKAGGQCLWVANEDKTGAGTVKSYSDFYKTDAVYKDNTYIMLGVNLSDVQKAEVITAFKNAMSSNSLKNYAKSKWLSVPEPTNIKLLVNDMAQRANLN